MMKKPTIQIGNESREMNDDEFVQFEADQAAYLVKKAETEAKATAKTALLKKLGITAEEAKLLLS